MPVIAETVSDGCTTIALAIAGSPRADVVEIARGLEKSQIAVAPDVVRPGAPVPVRIVDLVPIRTIVIQTPDRVTRTRSCLGCGAVVMVALFRKRVAEFHSTAVIFPRHLKRQVGDLLVSRKHPGGNMRRNSLELELPSFVSNSLVVAEADGQIRPRPKLFHTIGDMEPAVLHRCSHNIGWNTIHLGLSDG